MIRPTVIRISHNDNVTNEEVCVKIQQAIGPHEDVLIIVKRCKLITVVLTVLPFIRSGQNHLARHSERVKERRQTEESLDDNIRKWTGLEFTKSQRDEKNREKWRNWL